MTSADQVALADIDVAAVPAMRRGSSVIGAIAMAVALLSALVTFLVLTGLTSIIPTHEVVVTVLLVNAGTVLVLLAVIVREVWHVAKARRQRIAGARLHVRIVGLFSVIAAVPAILVAIIASITLDRGLDRWFSTRTQAVIANSLTVAQAYLREHGEMIRGDILAMAIDVSRAKPLFDQDRTRFRQFLNAQASIRGLPAALIIRGDLTEVERSDLQFNRDFVGPSASGLAEVTETEPQIAQLPGTDYVAAIIKLRGYDNSYLYVARPLSIRRSWSSCGPRRRASPNTRAWRRTASASRSRSASCTP
jgi:two-component system nitrogen regulation sensor histidine kinase NtrY